MKILINATSAVLGGGLTVLRQLLPAFAAVDEGRHSYLVMAREDVRERIDPRHPRVRFLGSRVGGRSLATRLAWEQIAVPVQAALGGADVLLSPTNLAVLGSPVPQVLMFQNLVPFSPDVIRRRKDAGKIRFPVLRRAGILSARRAASLVFISKAQQAAILPWLSSPIGRIELVYLGRDPAFSPAAKARAPELLRRLGLGERYVLSVSQFYHYKNLVELVRGFALAAPRLPAAVALAIAGAGHERAYVEGVRQAAKESGLADRVRFLGQVDYTDLPPLYAAASLFVFPSTCESFPNILIEGLASGVPTLSSRLCSMPELAGDAAVYFDPFSPEDIASKLVETWEDEGLRGALAQRGVAQVTRYDWQATAGQLLRILEAAGRRS